MPGQKFILKLYYKIPLNDKIKTIIVRDKFNEHILYEFTEQEYLNYLYNEGRCNIRYIDDKVRNELVLIIGRRGTKCVWEYSEITTTEGTLNYRELLDRLKKGEKIGIFTYDENWNKKITYDILAENNGIQETVKVTTTLGRSEIVTKNHPYLVWQNEQEEPGWVEASNLKKGDFVAIASSQDLFGTASIGEIRAEMLAHQYGIEKNSYRHRKIPDVIKKSPKNELKKFLNIIFYYTTQIEMRKNTDRGFLYFYYPFKEFVEDIQRELLKFGIITLIRPPKSNLSFWSLAIANKENVLRFEKEIGIFKKEKELSVLAGSAKRSTAQFNAWSGLPPGAYLRAKYTRFGSRRFSVGKVHKVKDELMLNLVNAKVYWDTIKEVKDVGRMPTVSLEVKGTNIIGNDIISHNSTISSWIAAYETYRILKIYHPQKYFGLLPDAEIQLTTIATTEDQANTLFRVILGHFSQCNYFHRYMGKPLADKVLIRSRRDIEKYGDEGKSSIIVRSSPCSARAMRGVGNLLVIMDEQAHFVDEKTQSNKSDKAVYDAITPSVATFKSEGRIINISSPLTKSGVLWDLHNLALEGAEHLLLVKAPSWEINPYLTPEFFKSRYKADPLVYECEFGAEFSDRIRSWLPEEYLRKVIVPELRPKKVGLSRTPHFLGLDVGFKEDGTAIAVTHITQITDEEGKKVDKIELDYIESRQAGVAPYENLDILDFESIADWISEICSKFHVVKGLLDQHNGIVVAQNLSKRRLPQFDLIYHTRNFNSEIYQNLMMLIIDRKLRLYNVKPDEYTDGALISELLKLQVKQHSKNVIEVESPRMKGSHDDLSDALARSVWLASDALRKGLVSGNMSTSSNRHTYMQTTTQYQVMKNKLHNVIDTKRNSRRQRANNWMTKNGR